MLMGCFCCKSTRFNGDGKIHLRKSIKRFITLSKRGNARKTKADAASKGNPVVTQIAVSKPQDNVVTSLPTPSGESEKRTAGDAEKTRNGSVPQRWATVGVRANRDGSEDTSVPDEDGEELKNSDVSKEFSGEHATAGWPQWLTDVAWEAIKGWLPRKSSSFEKLEKIGQGTYSSVYKARDLETGKIVALKKVRFVNMDPESVRFMAREIHILRQLDHPNVIKLEGIVASRLSSNLYLVFPYMEHDLTGLAARPGHKFTEPQVSLLYLQLILDFLNSFSQTRFVFQVKCFVKQLLEGLAHCHSRGVLHRDIKGSNLLIDSNGILKIADFGLATFFSPAQQNPLTSRVVTLWYRPPELLLGATEYGVAVDLWSSGCILAELFAGKPIMPGRTEVEQLHKIFKLCGSPSDSYWKKSKLPHTTIFKPQHQYKRCISETFKGFPSSALTLLDSLLAIEPAKRGTAASALDSEFFKTKPLPCDPSSLPKYPPSKEYDIKLRDEAIRRKKAEATKDRSESVRPAGRRETKGMVASDATTDLQKHRRNKHAEQNDERGSEFYHSALHPGGSSQINKTDEDGARSYTSMRVSNGPQMQKQRSYRPLPGAVDLSDSATKKNTANSRYNRLDVGEPSDKLVLDRSTSTHKKDDRILSKESTIGYGTRKKNFQYSGPLMPAGENVDDMLKEHERLIQEAVRKARVH
ncbi:putative serine/threonine-protein kinase [Canna indica]|uniref:[RNA-polymerase]-subunit kinase n=1 Tax=Canna indica TaxID=4628 RepID=A0AAQ3KSZ3_9LILI|nr:putative serine/threonine-protein kinase [Canna indica]